MPGRRRVMIYTDRDDVALSFWRSAMTTITIDELRERLDEVIDQLAQGGEPVR